MFSIVLLALVDDDYKFTCIDVGSCGSASDGGIFAKSTLHDAIKKNKLHLPEDSVIVGDAAFSLEEYMMKSYPRRFKQSLKECVYNYRHYRARRIVENAFGILNSRFRIFSRVIDLDPAKVVKIVTVCCAMHNWIRSKAKSMHGITTDIEDTANGRIILGSWREEPIAQNMTPLVPTQHRHPSIAATLKRERYADYFMGEGEVEWQYRMVNLQVNG